MSAEPWRSSKPMRPRLLSALAPRTGSSARSRRCSAGRCTRRRSSRCRGSSAAHDSTRRRRRTCSAIDDRAGRRRRARRRSRRAEPDAGELRKRKTAGNAVELGSIAAFGFSPLWLLAAAADISRGSRVYLEVLVAELKRAGVCREEPSRGSVDDLLGALEGASGTTARLIDIPPLELAGAPRLVRRASPRARRSCRRRDSWPLSTPASGARRARERTSCSRSRPASASPSSLGPPRRPPARGRALPGGSGGRFARRASRRTRAASPGRTPSRRAALRSRPGNLTERGLDRLAARFYVKRLGLSGDSQRSPRLLRRGIDADAVRCGDSGGRRRRLPSNAGFAVHVAYVRPAPETVDRLAEWAPRIVGDFPRSTPGGAHRTRRRSPHAILPRHIACASLVRRLDISDGRRPAADGPDTSRSRRSACCSPSTVHAAREDLPRLRRRPWRRGPTPSLRSGDPIDVPCQERRKRLPPGLRARGLPRFARRRRARLVQASMPLRRRAATTARRAVEHSRTTCSNACRLSGDEPGTHDVDGGQRRLLRAQRT